MFYGLNVETKQLIIANYFVSFNYRLLTVNC